MAEELLNVGEPVRGLVRESLGGRSLAERGAEVLVADARFPWQMAWALKGVQAAFVLMPTCSHEPDPIGTAAEVALSLRLALRSQAVRTVVVLSTIGAHLAEGCGLITAQRLLEESLCDCAPSVTYIRAAFLLDDWRLSLLSAASHGVLPSPFTPLARPVPQVSSVDVGRLCADALRAAVPGTRVIELAGPRDYTPYEVAAAISGALGREVKAIAFPYTIWEEAFIEYGDSPTGARARVETIRASEDGRLRFQGGWEFVRGELTLEEVAGGWRRLWGVGQAAQGARARERPSRQAASALTLHELIMQ